MADERTIREDRACIDRVNWHIRKIQQLTGDTRNAILAEMDDTGYSFMTVQQVQMGDSIPCRADYGDQDALYALHEYASFLTRFRDYWVSGAPIYEKMRERVEKLGLKLVVDLRGATLYIPQDFIDSRKLHKVKGTTVRYSFAELGIEQFSDLLDYLEWKNEVYCTAEGRKRRLALAEQVLRFEEWEELPLGGGSSSNSAFSERLLEF